MRRFPTKRAAATLSVLTLCAGWVEAGSVSASAETPDHYGAHGCITVSGLTETSVVTTANPGDPTTHAGENGTTHDVITYPDGRVFGTEDGQLAVYYDGAGVPREMYTFTDKLVGGDTFGAGVIDLVTVGAGGVGTYHVVGTSGRYRGLSGDWTFTLTTRTATGSIAAVNLHLCP